MKFLKKITCTLIIPALLSTGAWADEKKLPTKKLLILPGTSDSASPGELGGLTRGISIGSDTNSDLGTSETAGQNTKSNNAVEPEGTTITSTRDENANQNESVYVSVPNPRSRKIVRKQTAKRKIVRIARNTTNRKAIKRRGAIMIGVYR